MVREAAGRRSPACERLRARAPEIGAGGRVFGVAFTLLAGAATSASALTIVPVYDSSVTSLANAAAIERAFGAVASQFDASFKTPVTVKIGVSMGTVNGQALGAGDISSSQSLLTGPFSYQEIVGTLHSLAAAEPGNRPLATAAATMPAKSPAGALPYELPYAEAQALGYLPAKINPDSGYVGFSTTVAWDYDSGNGVTAGDYDFEGLAAHEISEVLGRISGLESAKPTFATMFDTFRYSAPGVPSFSYSSPAYFSTNGGVSSRAPFNVVGGGDRGDWNPIAGDAQDATLEPGVDYTLQGRDLTALDVLGWGAWGPLPNKGQIGSGGVSGVSNAQGVPEPRTWLLTLLGFGLVGAARRRLSRGKPERVFDGAVWAPARDSQTARQTPTTSLPRPGSGDAGRGLSRRPRPASGPRSRARGCRFRRRRLSGRN